MRNILFALCLGSGFAVQAAPASADSRAHASAIGNSTQSAAGASRVTGRALAWANPRFVYRAEGRRVIEVLQDFAASQRLPAVVAEGIEGSVQASFDTTPDDFLGSMTKVYGILWYHDGTALYFYPSKAIQSRIFRLRGVDAAKVDQLLASLQLGDRRYPLRYNAEESTLLVYGPPRHVDLVSAALESLDVGVSERNRRVVRVVPLRFASAADRRFGDTVVPGLASTLSRIYAGAAPAAAPMAAGTEKLFGGKPTAGAGRSSAMQRILGVSPQGASGAKPGEGMPAEGSTMGIGARALNVPVEEPDDNPSFQADENNNAVIIRGRLQDMADHIDLVKRMDLRPALVELEAMILDVSTESAKSLGIAWSGRTGKASVSVSNPSGRDPSDATPAQGSFSISTLWSNAGRELLARIDALQADGKARVVAKPKVLGVANRAAVMKDNRVVAIRVAGNLEANLFQIEAGTTLQVTPQIMTYGDPSRIKLSLYIVDGSFEAGRVDSIPVTRKTEIVTEAHMLEGESLLIGGIAVDSTSQQANGVPGLSDVPIVGGLFRWNNQNVQRSERMFLITPRLVRDVLALPAAEAAPAPDEPTPAASSNTATPR